MKSFKEFLEEAVRPKLPKTKVVDKSGNPLRVYHGTSAAREFVVPSITRDIGMHFAEDPKASARALKSRIGGKTQRGGARTVPAFLDIQNPLEVEETVGATPQTKVVGGWNFNTLLRQLSQKGILATPAPDFELSTEEGRKRGLTPLTVKGKEILDYGAMVRGTRKPGKIDLTPEEYAAQTDRAIGNKKTSLVKRNRRKLKVLAKDLEKLGYDGMYYQNKVEGGGTSWIAFSPQQIVNAITGERGK